MVALGSVHVEREDKRRRPSYTDPALTSLYSSRREQDDGLSRRIRAGAGVGRGHAGPDAYHRCAYHRLDRPLCAGRPARHRSGAGPRPASRPGWEWPCAADPGAALVDRTAVGANGCQPAVDPGRAHVAATWAVYSRRARYDAPGAVGGLVGGDSRGRTDHADRVGRHALPVAQRPVPDDDHRPAPAVTGRLPHQRLVERGRGPGVSQCAALRPPAAGGHRLQCAVAVEYVGNCSGCLCDGRRALRGCLETKPL